MELFDPEWWPEAETYQETPDYQTIEIPGPGRRNTIIETLNEPVYSFTLNFGERDQTVISAVLKFFKDRRGAAEKFYYYSFFPTIYHYLEYVGVGTGAQTTYAIPFRFKNSSPTAVVYVNGVALSASDWEWTTDESSSPYRNRILLDSAPAYGYEVRISVSARKLYTVRFASQPMIIQWKPGGYGWQFTLKEAA